ncbi:MAG: hypothetical protein MJ059_03810 [Lachnospiraceae bacterium]|nr:hypothetical protein [Lachnospiraceae bacterium]
MAGNGFSPRKAGTFIDLVHIILGTATIVLAVLAVVNPEKNRALFPVIFFMASVINFVSAWFNFKMFPRMKKKRVSAFLYLFTGVLIFLLFVVSAVSIWGNL